MSNSGVVFLFPLVLSLIGALVLLFVWDGPLWFRLLIVGVAVAAAVVSLVAPLASAVPPAIPVLAQISICIGVVLFFGIDPMR